MKLLFKRTTTRTRCKEIKVSKSGITISGETMARLVDKSKLEAKEIYGGVGFNDAGEFCFFVATNPSLGMMKIHKSSQATSYRISINTEEAKEAVLPVVGDYSVRRVKAFPFYTEVILSKK